MKEYIEREAVLNDIAELFTLCHETLPNECGHHFIVEAELETHWDFVKKLPAADVVEEENALKFYYVRSLDDYWIGQRVGNFYYAEYDTKSRQWIWTHSRYLPWGKHVVDPNTLWKEHTYPSEPEEMPFEEWLTGFVKKYLAADVREVVRGKWERKPDPYKFFDTIPVCSNCGCTTKWREEYIFCPNCGADMRGEADGN